MEEAVQGCQNSSGNASVCAGSLICLNDVCACPSGYTRDTTLWIAAPDSCTLPVAGIESVYIISIVTSLAIAALNFRDLLRTKPGPAHTTFCVSCMWLVALCLTNLCHWLEGYYFGPASLTTLFLFQILSTAALCGELYHVIGPMMLLTRRTGASQRTRLFIRIFLGVWIGMDLILYVGLMCATYLTPDLRNPLTLGLYNYFLVQFISNLILSYICIDRVSKEIISVRDELIQFPRADDGARQVIAFYVKLAYIFRFVVVHLAFVSVFIVVMNVSYVFYPDYGWPFYTCTILSYPVLGLIPLIFYYSGGKSADAFASEFETSAHTGLSLRL